MAITYEGGSGLFDKLGPVVALVNLLDTFETSSSAGALEKELSDIETELETEKEGDSEALVMLLTKWEGYANALHTLKSEIASLTEPLLASEIVASENLHSDDLSTLLNRLVEVLIRDGRKVVSNTIALSGTSSEGDPHGFWDVAVSLRDTNEGVDSSSQYRGDIRAGTYRILCIDPQTFEVSVGYHPNNSPGSPNYEKVGFLGTISFPENLVSNGGFEQISGDQPIDWITSPNFGTNYVIQTTESFESRALMLVDASEEEIIAFQVLDPSAFVLGGKYVLSALIKGYAGEPQEITIRVVLNNTVVASIEKTTSGSETGFVVNTAFFNVTDPLVVSARVEILCPGTESATPVSVDNIIVSRVPEVGGIHLFPVMYPDPSTSATPIPPVPGSSIILTITNNKSGKFQTFFSRFFNVLLPSYGANSAIDDSLAS